MSAVEDRQLRVAALLTIPALLLSGPIGALVAHVTHPQPTWRDVATFAANFHPTQQLPYVFGLALLAVCAWFVARAATLGGRPRPGVVIATSGFVTLVLLNYIAQLGFVPHAARENSELAGALSMSNPHSLAWLLEMTGYGLFGIATWLVAPVFAGDGRRRWIRGLLVANGVTSVASALATYVSTTWILSAPGVAAYAVWNLLVIVAMALIASDPRPVAAHANVLGNRL